MSGTPAIVVPTRSGLGTARRLRDALPGARLHGPVARLPETEVAFDGLDVTRDLPRFARDGWESIADDDRERLKWLGIFFRRQTPGRFMMRVRISNGLANTAQLRTIAEVAREFGTDFVDITTRQQIQLRWLSIKDIPAILARLTEVGLTSLQTGMDNIRNVVGCPGCLEGGPVTTATGGGSQ